MSLWATQQKPGSEERSLRGVTIALALVLLAACAEARPQAPIDARDVASDDAVATDTFGGLDTSLFGPTHCSDGVQSGDEPAIDCGGSCLRKCPPSSPCLLPTDCSTGRCVSGLCEGTGCVSPAQCPAATPFCVDGNCAECGIPMQCDDGNACTDDRCEFGQCFHVPGSGSCDDGFFCNGTETCSGGVCQPGTGNPCGGPMAPCQETTKSCDECMADADCGAVSRGQWSGCQGFAGDCGTQGTRTRDVITPRCTGGSCTNQVTQESEGCTRNTDGQSCGAVTRGAWSAECNNECGSFQRQRTVTTPTCQGGGCNNVNTTETDTCQGQGNGAACGSNPSYCGRTTSCHVCSGSSCVVNGPHYDGACEPSCGHAGALCGATAICCGSGASCPLGELGPTWDCAKCCNSTCN